MVKLPERQYVDGVDCVDFMVKLVWKLSDNLILTMFSR